MRLNMNAHSALFLALSSLSLVAADQAANTPATQRSPWVVYEGEQGPGKGKNLVLISGDEEYRSEETLAQLGKILARHHGFNCKLLFAIDPQSGVVDPNNHGNIPGLEALKNADLMILFIRFRNLPDGQMQYIDDYLKSGKPVLGIRTATHAFRIPPERTNWLHYHYRYNPSPNDSAEKQAWKGGFGRLVLGDTWWYHHGYHNQQSTRGLLAKEAKNHPILRGLKDGEIWGPTDVYAVHLPLPDDWMPIVIGQTINRKAPLDNDDMFLGMRPTDDEVASTATNPTADIRPNTYNPNDPMMPIAWTKSYQVPGGKKGKVFVSTIGASTDLVSEGTRRLLVNAVYWSTGLEDRIPADGTKVDLVGTYKPTVFRFQPADYWKKKGIEPAAFQMDN